MNAPLVLHHKHQIKSGSQLFSCSWDLGGVSKNGEVDSDLSNGLPFQAYFLAPGSYE